MLTFLLLSLLFYFSIFVPPQTLLDLDGSDTLTFGELRMGLEENRRIESKVRKGRDDTAVMSRLGDYLADNDALIAQVRSGSN